MGITYRRIPVVAIGNDVYCDSSLIASALERRFPKSKGYPTLFPARKGGGSTDTGLVKAFSMYYGDRAVFASADLCLPYQKFPDAFVKDRGDVRHPRPPCSFFLLMLFSILEPRWIRKLWWIACL